MCTAEKQTLNGIPVVLVTRSTLVPSSRVDDDVLVSVQSTSTDSILLRNISFTQHKLVLVESSSALKGNASLRSNVNNETTAHGWSFDGLMTFKPHQHFTFSKSHFIDGFSFEIATNMTTRAMIEDVSVFTAGKHSSTVSIMSADALQAIVVNHTHTYMRGLSIANRVWPASLRGKQQLCKDTETALLSISGSDALGGTGSSSHVICESCRFVSNMRQCIMLTKGATL
jgi:hypothetical protein